MSVLMLVPFASCASCEDKRSSPAPELFRRHFHRGDTAGSSQCREGRGWRRKRGRLAGSGGGAVWMVRRDRWRQRCFLSSSGLALKKRPKKPMDTSRVPSAYVLVVVPVSTMKVWNAPSKEVCGQHRVKEICFVDFGNRNMLIATPAGVPYTFFRVPGPS